MDIQSNLSALDYERADETPWPAPRKAWWAVFVFGLTLMVGFVDRSIITLMVEPIKHDLSLSDTQISLVLGFAYIAFYLVLGLPLARWIDTGPRRVILGACIGLWSICTALCGLASTFWQLALFRIGVGAGDAGVSPAIGSMISDLFPREKLARAFSLLALAYIAGTGIAMVLGGFIMGELSKAGDLKVGLLGTLHPWQLTFIIIGLPGLLASALYLTVPEPRRRDRWVQSPTAGAPSLLEVLRFLAVRWRVYAPMFAGLGLSSLLVFGTMAWAPAYFGRTHHWSPEHFGLISGVSGLIASPIGLFTGFQFTEWFIRRGLHDANLRLTLWSQWLGLPFIIGMPLMPTPQLAVAVMAIGNAINVAAIGSQNAALVTVTPNEMRAQVTALYLVMYNVIGYGLGPTLIALMTDFVLGSEALLSWALLAAAAVLGPLAAWILTLGLKPYGRAVAAGSAWADAHTSL